MLELDVIVISAVGHHLQVRKMERGWGVGWLAKNILRIGGCSESVGLQALYSSYVLKNCV